MAFLYSIQFAKITFPAGYRQRLEGGYLSISSGGTLPLIAHLHFQLSALIGIFISSDFTVARRRFNTRSSALT